MRRILSLREEEVERFPRTTLTDADVRALAASRKFEIDPPSLFNGHTYGVKSRGWVGQIQIGNDLSVRVTPKVPVSHLFQMLEVAYNLRSFRLFEGDMLVQELEDIYERIVSILARRVLDRARKGLYRSYISESDELPYVRGSIDVLATVLNTKRGVPRAACRYEEQCRP